MDDFEVNNFNPRKKRYIQLIVTVLILITIGTICFIVISRNLGNQNNPSGLLDKKTFAVDDKTTLSDLYENVCNSVVTIKKQTASSAIFGKESDSIGSGFIVTAEGHIVTNYHVISGASSITVELLNGHSYSAETISYDSSNDIAVIKITPNEHLCVAYIGDSSLSRAGDWVFAIGTPYSAELFGTITRGIISYSGRRLENSDAYYLQVDAAINPGNSGGPLFNMAGEVIGINTSKISPNLVENIGFSISSKTFRPIVESIINKPATVRTGIGITGISVSESYSSGIIPNGVIVVSVSDDGPADIAGIKIYDIIIKFDDTKVNSVEEIKSILENHKDGDTINIVVLRDSSDNEITLSLTLKDIEFYD